MRRIAAIATLCAAAAAPAHGDGYYFVQTMGVASGRGEAGAPLSVGLHSKLGVGLRRGPISIEPWISSVVTFDRDSATLAVFGGEPSRGHADLTGTGLDIKVSTALRPNLSLYVGGGPRYATGLGAFGGYDGP